MAFNSAARISTLLATVVHPLRTLKTMNRLPRERWPLAHLPVRSAAIYNTEARNIHEILRRSYRYIRRIGGNHFSDRVHSGQATSHRTGSRGNPRILAERLATALRRTI
jgi:hypothetical protein